MAEDDVCCDVQGRVSEHSNMDMAISLTVLLIYEGRK